MADLKKRGRKMKIVDEDQVLSLKAIGLKWNIIAELIGVLERTLRERRQYFQEQVSSYSPIENESLVVVGRYLESVQFGFGHVGIIFPRDKRDTPEERVTDLSRTF